MILTESRSQAAARERQAICPMPIARAIGQTGRKICCCLGPKFDSINVLGITSGSVAHGRTVDGHSCRAACSAGVVASTARAPRSVGALLAESDVDERFAADVAVLLAFSRPARRAARH